MSKLFQFLFDFFTNRKGLLALVLMSILGIAIALGLQLKLEEDVTKIMPINEEVTQFNEAFSNSKFSDRIILNVYLADSTSNIDAGDQLIAYCDSLVRQLKSKLDSTYITDITYQINQDQFFELYDQMYEHLPILLEEADYEKMAGLIDSVEIQNRINGAYKTLLSPASFISKKSILRDPLGLTNFALEKMRSFQLDDNFELYKNYIVTKDHRHLLLFLEPANSSQETLRNTYMLHTLSSTITALDDQFKQEIKASYFGGAAVAVGNANRIKWDVTMTVAIALFALFTFISLFYRRFSIFFYVLFPALFGSAIAIAAIYLWKGNVSVISIGVGSVLLGVTIDYSLHVFTHFRSGASIKQLFDDLSTPILLSSLTTASAFFCLFIIRSEALHDLGLFAGFSVIGAAFFALFLLPHFLGKERKGDTAHGTHWLDKIAAYPLHQNKWLVGVIGALSLLFAFTANRYHFETDMMQMNYMSDQLKLAENQLNEISSASLKGIYIISSGKDLDEALRNSEKIVPTIEQLKKEDKIRNYTSVSRLLLSDSMQQKRIQRWNQFWTVDKKESVQTQIKKTSQSLKFKANAFDPFYQFLAKDFQPVQADAFQSVRELFLDDYIKEGKELSTVMTLLNLESNDKEPIYQAFKGISNVNILDRAYLADQFVKILKEDFDLLVKLSLILVFVILHMAYGRIELGLIAFAPIALSWLWTIGLMNYFGLSFNIINVIITTFIFGLGIDYSIFIMRGLLQEYKDGEKNLTSYKTSILLSAITTLTGIGVLIFAQHPALRSIASISIIGVSSVLLLSLTVEPLLFRWLFYKKGGERREYPITAMNFVRTWMTYIFLIIGCLILTILAILLLPLFLIHSPTAKHILHYAIWLFSRLYIWLTFPWNKQILNPHGEDFSKPAVIISNHKSLIDTPLMFRLSPKILILTNDWVRKSPLFGIVARMADCYSVSSGIDELIPMFEQKIKEGYSIVVFPESTRSFDDSIRRFHKGAFYIAEKLQIDILPIFLHGNGRFLRKRSFWGKDNKVSVLINQRIKPDDDSYGDNYSARAKQICKYYRSEYPNFKESCEDMDYLYHRLVENYIYKGPVIEWYMRVKVKMEDNYRLFNELIPKKAIITDIGCGYGFMAYMLFFASQNRTINGFDYDEEKIKVAQNCQAQNEQINFTAGDITQLALPASDIFLICDMLHYLPEAEQWQLLDRCVEHLLPHGQLIIRDGDSDLDERHKGTKLTEIISTNIGFNKTKNELNYLSGKELHLWAESKGLSVELIDQTKHTSNVIYVIKA